MIAADDVRLTRLHADAEFDRRRLLVRGMKLAAGAALGSVAVARTGWWNTSPAFAEAAAAPLTGTLHMMNYPGWIGGHEVARFEKLHPGLHIKQIATPTGSIAARAAQVQQNPDAYDFLLADTSLVGQLLASGLVAKLDIAKIPNLRLVTPSFRSAYPHGIPNDFGKVGIGYRADLVSERITRWADVWRLAPKYSKRIVFAGLDRDCMGSTMKYLGFSGNSTNKAELQKCKQALLKIKPHLLAIPTVDVAKPLINGSAVIAMTWDFDVALAQQKQPHIKWVAPAEGMVAYLNGWIAVSKTRKLDAIEQFMNFHLSPPQYADFINTVGSAYVEPAASRYIEKTISRSPILSFDKKVLARVEFEKFLGQATADWSRTWDEFLAA